MTPIWRQCGWLECHPCDLVGPAFGQFFSFFQTHKAVLIEKFISNLSIKTLHCAILHRFARLNVMCHSTDILSDHFKTAILVNSVPLSLMICFGLPLFLISSSNSLTTLPPERDVSTTIFKLSLEN